MAIFLKANWENIIMVNYEIDPEILRPFLPKGVTIDLFEGKAYISLVGFMFKKTKIFNIPIPRFGTFEEINLRFYVKREEGHFVKRGVVFINETIPYPLVAWVANWLYKEHYSVVPTKHLFSKSESTQQLQFEWLANKKWNSIFVETETQLKEMEPNSFEEFIYQHYYGFTKVSENATEEYRLQHPRWKVYPVTKYAINCDFSAMYGKEFSIINHTQPKAVFVADGSAVKIEWKRNRLIFAHEGNQKTAPTY